MSLPNFFTSQLATCDIYINRMSVRVARYAMEIVSNIALQVHRMNYVNRFVFYTQMCMNRVKLSGQVYKVISSVTEMMAKMCLMLFSFKSVIRDYKIVINASLFSIKRFSACHVMLGKYNMNCVCAV